MHSTFVLDTRAAWVTFLIRKFTCSVTMGKDEGWIENGETGRN